MGLFAKFDMLPQIVIIPESFQRSIIVQIVIAIILTCVTFLSELASDMARQYKVRQSKTFTVFSCENLKPTILAVSPTEMKPPEVKGRQ